MALSALGKILLVSSTCAVALSVCIGVRGCGWPSSMSVCRMETAVFLLINRVPNSASAAHDSLDYLGDVEDGPIVERDFVLSGHEHVASSATAGFWFGEVRRIAVDCKDHVARLVGEYCFFLCGHKVEKLLTQSHCFFRRVCLLRSKRAEGWE
jgi:hypothetical protein